MTTSKTDCEVSIPLLRKSHWGQVCGVTHRGRGSYEVGDQPSQGHTVRPCLRKTKQSKERAPPLVPFKSRDGVHTDSSRRKATWRVFRAAPVLLNVTCAHSSSHRSQRQAEGQDAAYRSQMLTHKLQLCQLCLESTFTIA